MAVTAGINEGLVTTVWERQAFDEDALDALRLRVVFRGVPSDAGGPDYQDAILSRDAGAIVTGDIEFHVQSSDWYRHGHHRDQRYDRVILHVVWHDDMGETTCSDGKQVPILALDSWSRLQGFPQQQQAAPLLLAHPCVSAFAALSAEMLCERMREAGLMRFRQRAERLAAELSCASPDQVFYTALLEAMGYASNRHVFRELASVVPYAWLQSIPVESRLATLLEAAGLGAASPVPPPGHLPAKSWRLARLRPGNHPAVRLEGTALLLERLGPRPADGLVSAVHRAERPSDLRAYLMANQNGKVFIGAGRADEVAVSVVLPLVAVLQPETDEAERMYLRYPSPPVNRWTRVMQDLLEPGGHRFVPRGAAEHQGLHYLYHEHCRGERSRGCPVCDRTRSG